MTGDFFQLPPVTKSGKEPFFAFQSEAWKSCIEHTVTLTQVYRQKDGSTFLSLTPRGLFTPLHLYVDFVDLLNQMRRGEITPAAKQTFVGLSRPLPQDDGILPTELFPLRAEVDRANAARMAALTGPAVTYEARDSGGAPPEKRAKLLEAMVAPRVLALKADAQVMLVKNVDEHLVNGSVGRVLGFYAPAVCVASVAPPAPVTPPTKKEGVAKPRSAVLEPAKSNGFVRNVLVGLDGRTPIALCPGENKENKAKEERDASPPVSKGKTRAKDDELYPLVEFRTPQGKEVVLLARDEFRSEDSEGKLLARRVQVRAKAQRCPVVTDSGE